MSLTRFNLPEEALRIVSNAPSLTLARNVDQLIELAVRDAENGWHEVGYEVTGKGTIIEARVCRTRNGISANYVEPYMRRRDPDCMCIGDEMPTNKVRFRDRFGEPFDGIRQETFDWLSQQDLAMFSVLGGRGRRSDRCRSDLPGQCWLLCDGTRITARHFGLRNDPR